MYSPNDKGSFEIKNLIFILVFGILIYHFFIREDVTILGKGVFAKEEPIQENIKGKEMLFFKDYGIQKVAKYTIKAKVLSRKTYDSELAPIDFALGWGNMSDENILKDIEIWQSGRWYRYKYEHTSLSLGEIIRSSANTHIIPATDKIKKVALSIKKGEIIQLKGYLVRVTGKKGFYWNSSTTRNDTGNGGCEIMYVEDIKVLQP